MKAFVYILSFLVLNTVCKYLTDDFAESHLLKPMEQVASSSLIDVSVFKQKYTYLGKGKQAYVFVSEDGEHVLKLFRFFTPRVSINLFGKKTFISMSKIPFAPSLFAFFWKEEAVKQRTLDFKSYENAFHLLKTETEIEYLHLNKTDHLDLKIDLYDKIGVLHQLDLDESCFLLQKRADPLYPQLASLIERGKVKEAEDLLEKFAELCYLLTKKGIVNPTTIEKNYGCSEGIPLLIDVGRVLNKEDLGLESSPSIRQMDHTAHHMVKWLKMKSPSLALYFEKTLQKYKEFHEDNL